MSEEFNPTLVISDRLRKRSEKEGWQLIKCLETGQLLALDTWAGILLEHFRSPASVGEVIEILRQSYALDETTEYYIREACKFLIEERLLRIGGTEREL